MFNDDVNNENIRVCCKEIHFGYLIPAKLLNKPSILAVNLFSIYFPIIFLSVYDMHVGLLVECAQILD